MRHEVLERCKAVLPGWAALSVDEVEFDAPKGFSSFTMGVRPRVKVDPPAVLYRHLATKENAILDPVAERDVFLLLADHEIAAHCFHADETCRIEAFHRGRTLTADDVVDPDILRGIAGELHRFHRLEPDWIPEATFFELLHERWGAMAERVLVDHRGEFPPDERALCDDLTGLLRPETHAMVQRCLPDRAPVFCHNDTYHGNVMLLDDGTIKLLDFEFSCLNDLAFDFANLFAETVMVHGLADPPHFRIGEPSFTDADLGVLIGAYLDLDGSDDPADRSRRLRTLIGDTRRMLMLSDYMYAMAALPLALEPIQKIRFLPYAHQRFTKFRRTWYDTFGDRR